MSGVVFENVISASGTYGVIASIAALRSASTSTVGCNQLLTLGYATDGDGGEGPFWYNANDTTSADNGGTIIVDASGRRWYRQTQGREYSVKWFGAYGNGSNNDESSIQSTITALIAAGGGTVWFPEGRYCVGSGLSCPASGVLLRGAGRYASIILATFASGDIYTIGDGTTTIFRGCGVIDIGFESNVNRTSGAVIRSRNVTQLSLQRLSITNLGGGTLYDGISFESTNGNGFEQNLFDFEIRFCTNRGIRVGDFGTGTGSTNTVGDLWASSGGIFNCGVAIFLANVSAFALSKIDIFESTSAGVLFYPLSASNQNVTFGFCDSVYADTTSNGSGWAFEGTGIIANCAFVNCWGSSNAAHGFYLAGSQMSSLQFSNCIAIFNGEHGYELSVTCDVIFTGCVANDNSQTTFAFCHGWNIETTISGFQLIGCQSGSAGFQKLAGETNPQGYGIAIQSGTGANFAILGCRTIANATGGILNGATGTDQAVANNLTA